MLDDAQIVEIFMRDAREIVEELEYNENISRIDEVKIMFNSYGDDDDLGENMDKNIESYYMFIHRDSLNNNFLFPEHKVFRGAIVHRAVEIRIPILYNVEEDYWDINFLDNYGESGLDEEKISNILNTLHKKYCHSR